MLLTGTSIITTRRSTVHRPAVPPVTCSNPTSRTQLPSALLVRTPTPWAVGRSSHPEAGRLARRDPARGSRGRRPRVTHRRRPTPTARGRRGRPRRRRSVDGWPRRRCASGSSASWWRSFRAAAAAAAQTVAARIRRFRRRCVRRSSTRLPFQRSSPTRPINDVLP